MNVLKVCTYGICGFGFLIGCLLIGHLKADSPALIISEVKVRNDSTGFDEYIELYNPGTVAVSLNDYFIGYANTPNPTPDQEFNRSVVAQGLLQPESYYLLAKNATDPHLALAQKSPFSSLADAGGTLQLTDETGMIVDELRWTGTVVNATGTVVYMPGTTVAKGQSITRAKTGEGNYMITPASWQLTAPTPLSSSLLPLLPALTETVNQDDPPIDASSENPPENTDQTPSSEVASIDIEITELLPNPAAPATDETDEFIEVHNISTQAINLKDYKLQSGNSFSYSYTFPEYVLQPDQYAALNVSQTHLLLSNSGGRSRLLNPDGRVISQTDPYGVASPGKAWALIENTWQWTDTVTPGSANVASGTMVTTKATKPTKQPATKSTVKSAKTVTKPKVASTSKAKAKGSSKKNTPTSNPKNNASPTKNVPSIHPLMLAGVAASTVLYGLYEYRQDIGNSLRRLRGNRSLRREIGSQTQGSGSD